MLSSLLPRNLFIIVLVLILALTLLLLCKVNNVIYLKKKPYLYENTERKSPGCPVSTHAEMSLLKYANRKIRIDILVIRLSPTGKLGNSRPCENCILKLSRTNIQYVYYSTEQGIIVREKASEMLLSELTKKSFGYRKS